MSFRAEEAIARGTERARNYLVSRQFSDEERKSSETALLDIIDECGPVVDSYPSWHPLVRNHNDRNPETTPSRECGYKGLDHTVCFAHGFLTCPYGDASDVLNSISALPLHHIAEIEAEKLDVPFYNTGTSPILVRCKWNGFLEDGHLVPKKWAVPLMLEQELPGWKWAQVAETWETMRPYLLGQPHGNRSSLFVSQDTALAMKKIYISLTETGMFGPIKQR